MYFPRLYSAGTPLKQSQFNVELTLFKRCVFAGYIIISKKKYFATNVHAVAGKYPKFLFVLGPFFNLIEENWILLVFPVPLNCGQVTSI